MLELILHLEATPVHIGSRLVWRMLAGTIMRPRATSERMSSGERFSRCATCCISPVTSFSSSSSILEVTAELPMLELILHLEATPMHIGSRVVWGVLAGTIMRARATRSEEGRVGE